jgi:L-seryl-tRNA(Ser) seleniumtransferase
LYSDLTACLFLIRIFQLSRLEVSRRIMHRDPRMNRGARDMDVNETGGTPCDRFGNPLDPMLRYARGRILSDNLAEVRRQQYAFHLLRERFARGGDDSIYNLTGLIRAFNFTPEDAPAMQSYVHFLSRSQRELEALAIPIMGGDPAVHDGFLTTRVSAAMLAVMLTVLSPGDHVVSLVPADRSHPSIRSAVDNAQGVFHETTDAEAFRALLAAHRPVMVVISAISPSKHHLDLAVTRAAIAAAREAGCLVMLDDAHMAARIAVYDEPPALALGADVAVWSLDFSLGIEAQLGQYIAGLNAVRAWNLQPVRDAAALAQKALAALTPDMPRIYPAGAGLALSGEDLLELALARAGRNATDIAPIEAVAYAAIRLLDQKGAVTIPAVGVPGAACTLRLMLYPDGGRFGLQPIIDAMHDSVAAVADVLTKPERLEAGLLGAA